MKQANLHGKNEEENFGTTHQKDLTINTSAIAKNIQPKEYNCHAKDSETSLLNCFDYRYIDK